MIEQAAQLFDARTFLDARGSLGVIESADLPFDIQRVYYLFDIPLGAVRGEHAHRRLEQIILCMHGRVDITINDGEMAKSFVLDTPGQGLHLKPGMWRQLKFELPQTVVCVLASRPYELEDYIMNFEDFLKWVRAGRPLEQEDDNV